MSEPWQTLRAGDRIRQVAMPPEWDRPGYHVDRGTRRVVRRLIARGRPLRIYEVDDWGPPWVRFRFRRPGGGWEYRHLSICQGGWVRVRVRPRR